MSSDLDPVNTKPEKIKKATMIETTDHFIFVLEENSSVFKFLRFKEHFRKVPFSVDIRRNRRNKAAFSKFSSVVLTVPKVK